MIETYVCLLITAVLFLTTAATNLEPKQNRGKLLIDQLDEVRYNLKAVTESLEKLSEVVENECTFGGGISQEICTQLEIDNEGQNIEITHQNHPLNKRSVDELEPTVRRFLADLLRKKEMIQRLKRVLSYADNAVHEERKKSCQLNLGFHCQTQEYSAIADMFNFLGSGRSPGRRRRSIGRFLRAKSN